ncbi:hypothetical protein [Bradyrhizobium neotropicale]|uniref:hypothetical protein n=1 Tax=Bradyrhizobium neotropicale TaxID=1497615 RepID=UPI001AD67C6B|nr:hypothetical protein [Bradyrhizobium neotropicale]MBO4227224.1 hypothetical protein [Bradyrhizobium neotropicale]
MLDSFTAPHGVSGFQKGVKNTEGNAVASDRLEGFASWVGPAEVTPTIVYGLSIGRDFYRAGLAGHGQHLSFMVMNVPVGEIGNHRLWGGLPACP